ncbi:flagellar export protein FliJ [Robbsia andropogonis]|uniref:flagellar export protein FliJ n=1 Tax=Robbsia andropogonis TaxID=28092 RepID=UPI003D21AC55
MKQALPFTTLIDLAQQEVDAAAQALGALQRQRDDMFGKRKNLDGYRVEYEQQLAQAARDGMTMGQRRNYQAFLGTLGTAIDLQQTQVEMLDRKIEVARLLWQQKKQKLSSFETLETRARQAQEQRTARYEQRMTDEFAARRAREMQRGF